MRRPTFVSTEDSPGGPMLIVDRNVLLGGLLAEKILTQYGQWKIVFAAGSLPEKLKSAVDFISFKRKFPRLPDIRYGYIVLFFNGEEEMLDLLPDFIQKAKKDKARLFLVCKTGEVGHSVVEQVSVYEKASIIWLGDIFGHHIPLDPSVPIHRFIQESQSGNQLTVFNMGMRKTVSVELHDAIDGVIRAVFGDSLEKHFFVYPRNSPTELSLAWIFHKQNPLLKIDFVKGEEEQHSQQYNGTYVIDDSYPLKKKIQDIKKEDIVIAKTPEARVKTYEIPKSSKTAWPLKKIVGIFLCSAIVLPPLVLLVCVVAVGSMLVGAKYSLEKGDGRTARSAVATAEGITMVAQAAGQMVVYEAEFIGRKKWGGTMEEAMVFGRDSVEFAGHMVEVVEGVQKLGKEKNSNPETVVVKLAADIKRVILSSQKLQLEYQDLKDNPIVHMFLREGSVDSLHDFDVLSGIVGSSADVLPQIAGIPTKKKYLVLFQNNMELRPGGGFIGSYATVEVEKGRVNNFSIKDVYDADGQLRAHLEPPFAIRRYLPSVHWYLRDSNFDIDFTQGASVSALLLKHETGEQVDGVIGIDTTVIKNILKATGPIVVSDYNETVSEKNFYEITQAHAQNNFFAGSTQKKDFLRSLFAALLQELSSKKKISYISLARAVEDSLVQKHILVAFGNPSIQAAFTSSGVSSALTDIRGGEGKIVDFIGVNEANLGVNKVNYFIKRKIGYTITINDDGVVQGKLSAWYKNTSTAASYKTYVRFIMPQGAVLREITIDGTAQQITPAITDPKIYEASVFTPPSGLEVEEYNEEGKHVVGFLTTVSPNALKKVDVEYDLGQSVDVSSPVTSYSLKVFKQPGTESDQLEVSMIPPPIFQVSETPKGFTKKENAFVYTGHLATDMVFDVRLSPQK